MRIRRLFRSTLLASATSLVKPTIMETVEHRLARGRAVSVRAFVPRRAPTALMFREMKERRQ
jgi:hypothetical protein